MSVLLFHPSVAPFVQQAARAIFEAGRLDRFVTTLRHNPGSRRQRAACTLARLVGFDLATQLRRRSVTEVPAERVESAPAGEVVRLVAGRLDATGRLGDVAWEWSETAFDRRVARRIAPHHRAVYGFEHSSLATFQAARASGITVFYDVPAPETQFVRSVLDQEIQRHPPLRTQYHRHTSHREERRTARRHAEWQCADVVIAASRFTRDSFAASRFDPGKIQIVPYGAPAPAERDLALRCGASESPRLTLLWSGSFSARKGAHYTLEAWRRSNLGRHARLRVFGAQLLPDELLRPIPEGIELCGSIPRDELMRHYRDSDALLFPTLCDGFGMVATEAWSQGLPVITTDRAGAADFLTAERNGLLIRPGDASEIVRAVQWCLEHRAELRAMREAALATAASWQWSDYRAALRSVIETELAGRRS